MYFWTPEIAHLLHLYTRNTSVWSQCFSLHCIKVNTMAAMSDWIQSKRHGESRYFGGTLYLHKLYLTKTIFHTHFFLLLNLYLIPKFWMKNSILCWSYEIAKLDWYQSRCSNMMDLNGQIVRKTSATSTYRPTYETVNDGHSGNYDISWKP